jgi:hypothetical protein
MAHLGKEKAAAAAIAKSSDMSRTPESCTDHHGQMSADIQQQQLMSGWNLMRPALEYAEAPRDFPGSVEEKYAAAAWSAAAPSRQCLAGIEALVADVVRPCKVPRFATGIRELIDYKPKLWYSCRSGSF